MIFFLEGEGGMTIFEGMGHRATKMNITFFGGKIGYRIQFLSFFFKKLHTVQLKPEKIVLGHIFPHICDSIVPIVSETDRVHS